MVGHGWSGGHAWSGWPPVMLASNNLACYRFVGWRHATVTHHDACSLCVLPLLLEDGVGVQDEDGVGLQERCKSSKCKCTPHQMSTNKATVSDDTDEDEFPIWSHVLHLVHLIFRTILWYYTWKNPWTGESWWEEAFAQKAPGGTHRKARGATHGAQKTATRWQLKTPTRC